MDFIKKVNEGLEQIIANNNKAIKEKAFEKGQFVVNKKRFSCDINPQNKLCIEILPLGTVPSVLAIEDDEPGYFKFIKQHSVRFGEGGNFSRIEQTPLTTKYCENRKEVAEEILRLMNKKNESVEEDTEFDEFKSTLTRTENTEIGAELLDKDFAGELYLTAEEFSRDERSDLASWCCAMVDATNGKATINVEQFITWLAKRLNRIMNDKNIQERKLSDDGYDYAINSLDMPNKLAEFAKALDLEEVANALLNSEYCVKAMKLAQELEEEYNNLQK